jgi:hypothetical protein
MSFKKHISKILKRRWTVREKVLTALGIPMLIGVSPFMLWARSVQPTELDPELPAVAWVFAIALGGSFGLALAGMTVVICNRLGLFQPAKSWPFYVFGISSLLIFMFPALAYFSRCSS